MALTLTLAAIRARDLLTEESEAFARLSLVKIKGVVPTALEVWAKRVKDSAGYESLQADFSFTPVAGVIDLADATFDTALFDATRSHIRVASTNARLERILPFERLESGNLPNDRAYWSQKGNLIVIRSVTPSMTDYVTPVKVHTNRVPTLGQVREGNQAGTFIKVLAELSIPLLDDPRKAALDAQEAARIGNS